jgi:cobalt-zinc-cadmium efflux system protein
MVVEFVASAITGSLMLWSDGIHMLSHAASLGISFVAATIAARPTSKRFPFGLHRVEIIAAHVNGVGLAIFTLYIVYESIHRLFSPVEILSGDMLFVAIIGLFVNLLTAFILSKAGLEDLNTKSAFLHMLADTFSSVAIIIGGVIIMYTDWLWIDAVLSIVIAVVIGKWSWGLLKESFLILIDRTPKHIDYNEIQAELKYEFPQIKKVVEVKVWEIKTGKYCGTLKLQVENLGSSAYFGLQQKIGTYLKKNHQVQDITVQMDMVIVS